MGRSRVAVKSGAGGFAFASCHALGVKPWARRNSRWNCEVLREADSLGNHADSGALSAATRAGPLSMRALAIHSLGDLPVWRRNS